MSPYSITRENAELDLAALRGTIAACQRADLTTPSVLRELADSIGEQVQPTITEPTEFGSIVRAGFDEYSDRFLWQRGPKGGWTSEDGSYQGFFGALHDPEVLRVGVGGEAPAKLTAWDILGIGAEPATPPAEAVEADRLLFDENNVWEVLEEVLRFADVGDTAINKATERVMDLVRPGWRPTPEQVEAVPACKCAPHWVAADESDGRDPNPDCLTHPAEQVEAASAPAEGDAIEALIQDTANALRETYGHPFDGWRRELRDFASAVLEVQQTGVPVDQFVALIKTIRSDADDVGSRSSVEMWTMRNVADRFADLLPKEPTS